MNIITTQAQIISYRAGNLRGECLAEFSFLDLTKIPWDAIKRQEFPGYELIKSSHTRRVIKVTTTPPGRAQPIELYAKRMRIRRWRQRIASLLVSSKARREWEYGHQLRASGIDTPLPVIVAEEKKGMWLQASYLVLTAVKGKMPFNTLLKEKCRNTERNRLLKNSAQFIALLHSKGLYHDDLSSEHIFFPYSEDAISLDAITIIDLDNARLFRHPVRQWKRAKNVFQFLRSLSMLSRTQRMRFLIWYLQSAKIKRNRWHFFIYMVNFISKLKGKASLF
ncbi:hypothetical protein J7M23_03300 [Candidatus Sumerlaeota bacterium]|nr:hypothetical protein [Candidatus Sumerlaeota bacterium]